MGRVCKQGNGLKTYKEKGIRKRYNAKCFAYLKICNGYDSKEVIPMIVEKYDYAESTAKQIFYDASKRYEKSLMHDSEKITNKNVQRLEAVIDAATEEGDSATIIKAIDTQNRMFGVGNSYNIKTKIEGEEPFVIKIDS